MLPQERVAADAAFLASSSAGAIGADVERLLDIADLLLQQIPAEVRPAVWSARARLSSTPPDDSGPDLGQANGLRQLRPGETGPDADASADRAGSGRGTALDAVPTDSPGSRPPNGHDPYGVVPAQRPRPAKLADAKVLEALAEFQEYLNERTLERLGQLREPSHAAFTDDDWRAIAAFCGGTARAVAPQLTAADRRLRLWQISWWALQHERQDGDHGRISHRLNQLGAVLETFPEQMRVALISAHLADFQALVAAGARGQFLGWLAQSIADSADPGLAELRVSALARLGALAADAPRPSPSQPSRTRAGGAGASPEHLLAELREVWSSPLTQQERLAFLERASFLLDAKKQAENQKKLDDARAGDTGVAASLAHSALRSALWRARHREPGQSDMVKVDDLRVAFGLGHVVYQSSPPRSRPGLLSELTAVFGMTLLVWEAVSPSGYVRLIESLIAEQRDDACRMAIQRAGATEVVAYLGRGPGRRVLQRNPESWVEALSEWSDRFESSDLHQLVELLQGAGAQPSFRLHSLQTAATPAAEAEASVLFGPADLDRFDAFYQQGQLVPIAELLEKNRGRILAVVEAELSSESHATFQPPAGKADIRGGGRNQFYELAKNARTGTPEQARDAHAAFDRALRREKDESRRKILTEWKAYALFRGSSILEAEPVWAEAAENGYASKEVLWNLAVRKNQQGTPWRALRYLIPGIRDRSLPLSYVQFACSLAVATLRKTDGLSEGDPALAEGEAAREFLLAHSRILVLPSVHLLWFWLATSDPAEQMDDSAGTALVTYNSLRSQPYELPTIADIGALSNEERLPAIDRVFTKLEQLRDPHFRRTWRLWIGEYAELNYRWWPAWDRWATACEADGGDVAATVEVLRRAARSASGALRHGKLTERDRESRSKFLRSAVVRLLRYAHELDRSSLLDEIRDRYVQPVPELSDTRRSENAQLLRRLGLNSDVVHPPRPPESPVTDVWRSLHTPLGNVNSIADLDEALVRRVQAAMNVDPGKTGRHARLVEAALAMLSDVADLGTGLSADQASETLLRLSGRNRELLARVDAAALDQLVAPINVLDRILRNLAASLDAAPRPTVTLPEQWAGWPDDHESSSIPVQLSFPGPGSATAVRITGGWIAEPYTPQAAAEAEDLPADANVAYALPLDAPPPGISTIRVDVSYAWGPLTDLSATAELAVPHCVFSDYLARHGISAHEFPSPFVVDLPLDRDQVQTGLFQGRDQQLAEVRAGYGPNGFPPLPLCFYGIRKTGKTSLLRRVAIEIDEVGLVGLEVSLFGLRADAYTTDQLCLGLLERIANAGVRAGAQADLAVPVTHPNPIMLVEPFFESLAGAFAGKRVVVLLDEYQFMLWGANGEPLLDTLRPVHERGHVGFIAFSNQGLDPTNKTNSQLGLSSVRVDFLREADVDQLVAAPLREFGICVHGSAGHRIFEQAAGHPNFSARLAKAALERLNQDHRNVLTVSDVDSSAEEILRAPGTFTLSWFSKQNIDADEADAAIGLAKEDGAYRGLTVDEARARLGLTTEIAGNLEAKRVVEFRTEPQPNLRIRGRLLWAFLRRQPSVGPLPVAASQGSKDNVGLFVDLENLRPHKPAGMSYGELAHKLIGYAAGLGSLKDAWIAIASWNAGEDWELVKAELIEAGFLIAQEPSTFRTRRRSEKRDVADFVLAGQVLDEVAELGLTRVVIVTGDGDLLILINQLLEKNVPVRLISGSAKSRSLDYQALAAQRRETALAKGLQRRDADFDLVLLDDVLGTGAGGPTRNAGQDWQSAIITSRQSDETSA